MGNFSIDKLIFKFINRETILYTVFGILTSILNIVIFQLFLLMSMEYKLANILTLLIVKITAYIFNKKYVFKSKCKNFYELFGEFFRYTVTRGLTMLIDIFGLIFMVEYLKLDKLFSKIFVTVLVVVLNYILGKKHVFKNN